MNNLPNFNEDKYSIIQMDFFVDGLVADVTHQNIYLPEA